MFAEQASFGGDDVVVDTVAQSQGGVLECRSFKRCFFDKMWIDPALVERIYEI